MEENVQKSSTYSPDSTINNTLILRNSNSFNNFFSDNLNLIEDKSEEFPYIIVCSRDNNSYLKTIFYYGDKINQFSVFEVGFFHKEFNKKPKKDCIPSNYDSFYTENNIHLGMSKDELLNNKGTPHKESSDSTVVSYFLDDTSDFVRNNKMPSYFANYHFENDSLIKMRFGFDYP